VYDGNPPRAARELPRAEAIEPGPAVQPVSESQSAFQPAAGAPVVPPDPAAMEAAVGLLEQPASPAARTGS
jgi:hypothetical protein